MYNLDQISEALKAFANWAVGNEELRRATAYMLESGELEVVGIVDGEFILRLSDQPRAME